MQHQLRPDTGRTAATPVAWLYALLLTVARGLVSRQEVMVVIASRVYGCACERLGTVVLCPLMQHLEGVDMPAPGV